MFVSEARQAVIMLTAALCLQVGAQEPDWGAIPYTSHAAYQAVNADGFGVFPVNVSGPIRMRGVILNRPQDLLDGTPDIPGFLAGQWQVYIQAVDLPDLVFDDADFGGTALFMGQYIGRPSGNHPAGSYTASEWLAELDRLNHDPISGHSFAPGDVIEVRARAPGLHFSGKTNVNEQHQKDPQADFDVYLIQAGYGLPAPAVITLADVKDAMNQFAFDATRATGCEHYQGALVRINQVAFVDPTGWAPNALLEIADGTGLSFPVKIGLGSGFSTHAAPSAPFDVIGIMDQEDTVAADGYKAGYRIWLMDYDGSQVIGLPGAPTLVAAASRRIHGAVGAFDLPLSLSGTPTIEPRHNGVSPQLVLDFSAAVEAADGQFDCGEILVSGGTCQGVSIAGTQVLVDMVFDQNTCLVVTLNGIRRAGGGPVLSGDLDLVVRVQAGNVNGDAAVNILDLQVVKNALNQPVSGANFALDVNVNGSINILDLQAVKNNLNVPVTCP